MHLSIGRAIFIWRQKEEGTPIRIGIFAGIHGDEPEGTFASISFLEWPETNRSVVKDDVLFIYPICNPTGFEAVRVCLWNGMDLNREFWTHGFDGIITCILMTEVMALMDLSMAACFPRTCYNRKGGETSSCLAIKEIRSMNLRPGTEFFYQSYAGGL